MPMTTEDQKKRAYAIFNALKKHYPNSKTVLQYSNPWELVVAVILSAQCTDAKVNEVTSKLFPKFRSLSSRGAKRREVSERFLLLDSARSRNDKEELQEIINFAEVPIKELGQDIKSTGFYNSKAKSVQGAAQTLLEKFNGIVPKTITDLTTLPGVGRKTANVVLGNAFGIIEGIAVDTHVKKQAFKFGFTKNTDPEKIEQDLMQLFDKKDWMKVTYVLIEHGRAMRFQKDKSYEKNILGNLSPTT